MRIETRHKVMIGAAMLLAMADLAFMSRTPFFIPLLGTALSIMWLPFWIDFFVEGKRQKELESKFPEFVRNLTGAIKSGIPASQAVIHVSSSDYGALSPYIRKLANQLEWGIPFHQAFINFGKETNNTIIKRAIATVIQAERAGGNIEDVLLSITESLVEIKKIKEERRTSIHGQIMQSYIIFIVFLGVIVLIQNLLIPYMSQISAQQGAGIGMAITGLTTSVRIQFSSAGLFARTFLEWLVSLHGIFLMLSIIQGFFAGIVLGKLSEGDLTSGLKHSLIMGTMAFIIITLSQGLVAS